MRYSDNHKEKTRETLLSQGARELKQHGFAATGVDRLMKAAGLSGGALYAYYPSKDALLAAIVEREMQVTLKRLSSPADVPDDQALNHLLDTYLSLSHVKNPRHGCILPALAAELGRAPKSVQASLERAQQAFAETWLKRLGSKEAGFFLLSQCVGSILLARMTRDVTKQQTILDASKDYLKKALPTKA